MVNKVNSLLNGDAHLSRQINVEQPFRGGFSVEMYKALLGQSVFIGTMENYKHWKSNILQNTSLENVSILNSKIFSEYAKDACISRAIIIYSAERKRLKE